MQLVNVTFDKAHFDTPNKDYVLIVTSEHDKGVTLGGGDITELTPPPPLLAPLAIATPLLD